MSFSKIDTLAVRQDGTLPDERRAVVGQAAQATGGAEAAQHQCKLVLNWLGSPVRCVARALSSAASECQAPPPRASSAPAASAPRLPGA
jgi:hypothetical protein